MIRFLVLLAITIIIVSLMGAVFIVPFDTNIEIILYEYHIQTSIFTFTILFIIFQFALIFLLKILSFLFNINSIIQDKLQRSKMQKHNQTLLQSITQLLMDKKEAALGIINKILPNMVGDDFDNAQNLVAAETEKSFDKKIYYLRILLDKRGYNIYAAKKLTEIFYENGHYSEAENYAITAFNMDDTDTNLMLMLIRIYAKLQNYAKMVFVVSKLQRANSKLLEANAKEIAEYYFDGAKSLIESDNDEEAIKYVESALELKPDFTEALALFVELNLNRKNTALSMKLLKQAFAVSPSFDIAVMYINTSNASSKVAYETLAKVVNVNHYLSLFLAIASYLGLEKESSELVGKMKGGEV